MPRLCDSSIQNCERVVAGVLALLAGEELAPRLELGLVERVGARADLEDDRVELDLLALVEDRDRLALLLLGAEPLLRGPVDVADGRDPRGAELALRRAAGSSDR